MPNSIFSKPVKTIADEPSAADLLFEDVTASLDASWFGRYKPQFYFRAIDQDDPGGDDPGQVSAKFYLRPHFQIQAEAGDVAKGITLLTTNLPSNIDSSCAPPETEPAAVAQSRWSGSWHTDFTAKDPVAEGSPTPFVATLGGEVADLLMDILTQASDGQNDGGRHTPFFANYRPQFYFRSSEGWDGELVFGDDLTVLFEDAPNPAVAIALLAATGGVTDEQVISATLAISWDDTTGARASHDITMKGSKINQNSGTSEFIEDVSYVSIAELRDALDFFM